MKEDCLVLSNFLENLSSWTDVVEDARKRAFPVSGLGYNAPLADNHLGA
jgi:hypothetical protein